MPDGAGDGYPPTGVAGFVVGTIKPVASLPSWKPVKFYAAVKAEEPVYSSNDTVQSSAGFTPVDTIYALDLHSLSEKDIGTVLDLPMAEEVKPNGADRFLVRFEGFKTGFYDLRFSFLGSKSVTVDSDRIELHTIRP